MIVAWSLYKLMKKLDISKHNKCGTGGSKIFLSKKLVRDPIYGRFFVTQAEGGSYMEESPPGHLVPGRFGREAPSR